MRADTRVKELESKIAELELMESRSQAGSADGGQNLADAMKEGLAAQGKALSEAIAQVMNSRHR